MESGTMHSRLSFSTKSKIKFVFTLYNRFGKGYRAIIDKLTDISQNLKKLLKHLAFRAYKDGYISECQKSIAKKLGVTTRTIRNLTKTLIEKGYIKIDVPDLSERRSKNSKIIYKILPQNFIKKSEFSGEFSGENQDSTYYINKELKKPAQGGPFFSKKFIDKKLKKGVHPEAIKEALRSCEKNKHTMRNPYAYFNSVIKIQNGKYHEADSIRINNERKHTKINPNVFKGSFNLDKLTKGFS